MTRFMIDLQQEGLPGGVAAAMDHVDLQLPQRRRRRDRPDHEPQCRKGRRAVFCDRIATLEHIDFAVADPQVNAGLFLCHT